MICCCDCFGDAFRCIAFREHRLPLKVRGFNKVSIDDPQFADTGTSQGLGMRRPERAAADNRCTRFKQSALALLTDTIEEDLTAVTLS
jgi:hypothetical protein